MQLNKTVSIKIKDGYKVEETEAFLRMIGCQIENISGNNMRVRISDLMLLHLRAHNSIENIDGAPETTQPNPPAPAVPAPIKTEPTEPPKTEPSQIDPPTVKPWSWSRFSSNS